MKKALAILMVLAAITGVAVADVADIAVSGFAKLSWGVDLENDSVTGFKQGNEWDISIPLLAKKTFTTKSEGDAYAEISIVDAQYYLKADEDQPKTAQRDDVFTTGDKKIDKITAKLVFGNIYATISNAPSFYTDNANIWAPIKNDDYFNGGQSATWSPTKWVDSASGAIVTDPIAAAAEGRALRWKPGVDGKAGTVIGYKAEKFSVAGKLASYGNMEELNEDYQSKYAFGVDFSVMPSDMISLSGTFNNIGWMGTVLDEDAEVADTQMTVGAKAVVKPMADLTVTVGFDGGSEGKVDSEDGTDLRAFAYDVAASAVYKFVEAGVYYASAGTPAEGTDEDGYDIADLAVYAKLTDGGMIPNVTGWVTVMANHLLTSKDYIEDVAGVDSATAPLAIGAGASYKYMMGDVKYVKPFAELFGQTMSVAPVSVTPQKEKGTEFATAYNFGVEYGLFTNAIITAKFSSGGTKDDARDSLIALDSSEDAGDFVISAKITY